LIGDPSEKAEERPLLTREVLEENVAGIRVQMAHFLDFEPSAGKVAGETSQQRRLADHGRT
jgi:tyrosyl-tRNA synthetase